MYDPARFAYPAFTVGGQMDSKIKVWNQVKCRDPVKQMPSLCCIHAAEYHVALRDFLDSFRIEQIFGDRVHQRAETDRLYRTLKNINFKASDITFF